LKGGGISTSSSPLSRGVRGVNDIYKTNATMLKHSLNSNSPKPPLSPPSKGEGIGAFTSPPTPSPNGEGAFKPPLFSPLQIGEGSGVRFFFSQSQ